ncbi:large ribosomal subunit protein uL10c [Elaeis guineensis]|uniref:large ribosomal subunit protein uL10c n=1 Tax=Elaeis guineensis var. tenera TaxID=51953 RepID=UPI003C6DA0DD
MEASLCSFPSSRPPPLQSLTLTKSPGLSINVPNPSSWRLPRIATIRAAITRTKKEETVATVKKQLENCHLVAGIRYKGFTVKQFQDLRDALPDSVTLLVAKNTLVGKAVEGTPWEALKPCMKGMNAWLFVHTEEIPQALKPYRSFQKEQKLDDNDFAGAVFEGKFYGPDDFKALETMPSRAEIYAKLLGSLQSPAISLVSTLQAPARDVVLVLKAYVKKLEEESGAATQ